MAHVTMKQRSLLWLNFFAMKLVNDKKHLPVQLHGPQDTSRFFNMHEVDPSIPESAGIMVPEAPPCDRRPLRRWMLGLIHTSLKYPSLSPIYDITPLSDMKAMVEALWAGPYSWRMPVSHAPFEASSAFAILSNSLQHLPYSDFAALAGPNGDIDLSYQWAFETVDRQLLGGIITLRDGKIARLTTKEGHVDVATGGWPVERAAAVLCRSLFLHQFYTIHFMGGHYMGSMLASHIIQESPHDSRCRRLALPFMNEAIALLVEQLPVTTDISVGNVRTLFPFSEAGCLKFFQYTANCFSLENEFASAKKLYPDTFPQLIKAVEQFLGDEVHRPLLAAPQLHGGSLSTAERMATFIYLSTLNHYKHGYLCKPIAPYLNLVADDATQTVGSYGLVFMLSIFYSATLEKSLLLDNFEYLFTSAEEKAHFTKVRDGITAMAAKHMGVELVKIGSAINN